MLLSLPRFRFTPPTAVALLLTVITVFTILPAVQGQGSAALRYVRGYSIQRGMLCYGFSNGIWHCTRHWYRSGSRFISLNTPFVPTQRFLTTRPVSLVNRTAVPSHPTTLSRPPARPTTPSHPSTPPAVPAPAPTGTYTSRNDLVQFCGNVAVDFSNASAWATPRGCFGRIFTPTVSNYPARPSVGFCNWSTEESHVNYAGNAVLSLAKHYGAPRVGAVVWFNGGVQGASADGHWANLVAIGPHGWGLIEEENFVFRGGGFGRIDYRFIQLYAGGVAYLYA